MPTARGWTNRSIIAPGPTTPDRLYIWRVRPSTLKEKAHVSVSDISNFNNILFCANTDSVVHICRKNFFDLAQNRIERESPIPLLHQYRTSRAFKTSWRKARSKISQKGTLLHS